MIEDLQVNKNKCESLRSNRNDRPYKFRLQDMPYNTNWEEGKPIRKNGTPDPLK